MELVKHILFSFQWLHHSPWLHWFHSWGSGMLSWNERNWQCTILLWYFIMPLLSVEFVWFNCYVPIFFTIYCHNLLLLLVLSYFSNLKNEQLFEIYLLFRQRRYDENMELACFNGFIFFFAGLDLSSHKKDQFESSSSIFPNGHCNRIRDGCCDGSMYCILQYVEYYLGYHYGVVNPFSVWVTVEKEY